MRTNARVEAKVAKPLKARVSTENVIVNVDVSEVEAVVRAKAKTSDIAKAEDPLKASKLQILFVGPILGSSTSEGESTARRLWQGLET
mmetsp:Transcript_11851/g.21128  ORF Transcript_11851/g.21128 Transcript_11851/m.21128 type:complete len:88 (+) Transcript_11851:136-399(+)